MHFLTIAPRRRVFHRAKSPPGRKFVRSAWRFALVRQKRRRGKPPETQPAVHVFPNSNDWFSFFQLSSNDKGSNTRRKKCPAIDDETTLQAECQMITLCTGRLDWLAPDESSSRSQASG